MPAEFIVNPPTSRWRTHVLLQSRGTIEQCLAFNRGIHRVICN